MVTRLVCSLTILIRLFLDILCASRLSWRRPEEQRTPPVDAENKCNLFIFSKRFLKSTVQGKDFLPNWWMIKFFFVVDIFIARTISCRREFSRSTSLTLIPFDFSSRLNGQLPNAVIHWVFFFVTLVISDGTAWYAGQLVSDEPINPSSLYK